MTAPTERSTPPRIITQGHADRGDADRRRLAHDVAEVDRLEEGVGEGDRDAAEHGEHAQDRPATRAPRAVQDQADAAAGLIRRRGPPRR